MCRQTQDAAMPLSAAYLPNPATKAKLLRVTAVLC
jgi:hypothetical protein